MFKPSKNDKFSAPQWMSNKGKYTAVDALGFILMVAILSGMAFYHIVLSWPQNPYVGLIHANIPHGASLKQIAEDLKGQQVVTSPKLFVTATRLMGYGKSVRSGVFPLYEANNTNSIVRQLMERSPILHRITVPEGAKLKDIALMLEEKLKVNSDRFLSLCQDQPTIRSLGLSTETLEGFLFPETYFFHGEVAPEIIIAVMVEQYLNFFSDSLKSRAQMLGFNEYEILILASIIEGEAVYDSERVLISAVYHNRLKKGMRLQADPTIQYIIKDGPRRLFHRDLSIDTPYNTYRYAGLPPTPINNPGRRSILAALYPADVKYLYFVAQGNNYHTFSNTEEEHLKAKRRFQKVRESLRRNPI